MKSVMKHDFSKVPQATINRSSFDRSSGFKTTFNSGFLIPFFVDEALPGDTFNLRTSGFARLSTPIYPIMDNLFMETFYFAVPLRLVWDNFQKMMGEQLNPNDSTDYLVPQIVAPTGGFEENSVFDYMGIPTKKENLSISALPLRAHNLIYNEWFRDQNLQNSTLVRTEDTDDSDQLYTIYSRGKRHDYFTSSLPFPQKGPEINLPIGATAPVIANPANTVPFFNAGALDQATTLGKELNTNKIITGSGVIDPAGQTLSWNQPNLQADLSSATGSTINQLRQAFQIQAMFERDARGGTRYTEIIRSHFSVTSPDARLQRPEYLGGGSTPINISPVSSTAGNKPDDTTGTIRNLADLSAIGTASFQGNGFSKSFTEHTIILGYVNVRADLTYQQGLNRMWSRRDRLDFYWPSFAQLGEQEVLQKEIFATGVPAEDDLVFGYQERFAEYRYKPSLITGRFRSNSAVPLDSWHLAQNFTDAPKLENSFIVDNPPLDRVLAVTGEPQFIADFYHKLTCARPMPMYPTPYNLGRF